MGRILRSVGTRRGKREPHQQLCIQCGRYRIVNGKRQFVVNEGEGVGCNLCTPVCPVENCITLVHKVAVVDPRTGRDYAWPVDNPAVHAKAAE